jgi:hypothetical protein
MNKEFSSETRFWGGHGVFVDLTRHRWPWLEFGGYILAYFHPWFFIRIKVDAGFIGLGFQLRLGGAK